MPGCEALDRIAENEYAMRMKMVLASISGLFAGKVKISDPNPPASYRLMVEGSGKIGFMKGEGVLTLRTPSARHERAVRGRCAGGRDDRVGGAAAARHHFAHADQAFLRQAGRGGGAGRCGETGGGLSPGRDNGHGIQYGNHQRR